MLNLGHALHKTGALRHIRHLKHEVVVFHVSAHRHEKDFEYQNRPHKFVDLETGEALKLNPNAIREGFLRGTDTFKNLKTRAAQNKIDLVSADINSDFQTVLLPYLLKRSKLYWPFKLTDQGLIYWYC